MPSSAMHSTAALRISPRGSCCTHEDLSFDHPESAERVTLTSPLPEDFREALRRLGLDDDRLE